MVKLLSDLQIYLIEFALTISWSKNQQRNVECMATTTTPSPLLQLPVHLNLVHSNSRPPWGQNYLEMPYPSAWFDVKIFFDKTKSAIVSFFSLTKLKTRPFLLIHSVEWTIYLKSPLYQKIKHMHSAGKTWHFWFKFSSPRAQMTSNAWHPPTWVEGGGFKLQIDWHIYCMLETNIRESKLHVIIKALEN